jgi:hypothetical protein
MVRLALAPLLGIVRASLTMTGRELNSQNYAAPTGDSLTIRAKKW